jgi:TraM recognition site of TraD and TraG
VPLDEAANICHIADLPDLYSHLGSRGITPVTILQSYEQGITVCGEHGMAAHVVPVKTAGRIREHRPVPPDSRFHYQTIRAGGWWNPHSRAQYLPC